MQAALAVVTFGLLPRRKPEITEHEFLSFQGVPVQWYDYEVELNPTPTDWTPRDMEGFDRRVWAWWCADDLNEGGIDRVGHHWKARG